MVETRNGGDREKVTNAETSRSVDLQQIQKKIEVAKINYDKLARNDRSTTMKLDTMATKVDSVEKRIAEIATDSTVRFVTLEKQMTHITDVLTRLEESAIFNQRPGKEIASASQPPHPQVPITIPESEISPNQLGYRGINHTLANRDKMLRKIEMHVFSGPLPFDWISRVERFFRFGNYNEEEKLHLVSLSLEGPVLQWFNGEVISDPFVSWEQFTQRMLDRFGGPIDNDPAARLFRIQQEGEIDEYVHEFEALRNQVTGIDEKNLIKVFFNGLKSEMKEVIRLKEPVSLTDHKLAVLKMQSTTFCKVVSSANSSESQRGYGRQSSSVRSNNSYTKPSGDNTKALALSNKENNNQQKANLRPRLQCSDAELDQMRKDKICFRCKAPWNPAHNMICPNRQLRVLTVINGLELEVVNQFEEEESDYMQQQQVLHTLSLNSYLGIESLRRLR